MKPSFMGNLYRQFGAHVRANRADAASEDRQLLRDEHRKPENQRPRKILYEEIMKDLATMMPSRFLDRKVQAYMSLNLWPPMSLNETFDKVEASGVDNAWTTSVPGASKLLMLSHADVYHSMRLEFGPHRATFTVDGIDYRVESKSAAMTIVMVHFAAGRLRYKKGLRTPDLGPHVVTL